MSRRSRPKSPTSTWIRRIVKGLVLAGLAAETAVLRQRLAKLKVLGTGAATPVGDRRAVLAKGVHVDVATVAAAQAHADTENLAVLDLVPRDLPVAQAMDLLHELDPAAYRTSRHAAGRGGWHAVLADDRLLRQAGMPGARELEAAELADAVVELKHHAPADTDVAVAPGLATAAAVTGQDAAILGALHRSQLAGIMTIRLAFLAGLAATGLLGPGWAALLLGAWSAQPAAVFAGSKTLRPKDLARASLTRVVSEPRRLATVLRAAQRQRRELDPIAASRPRYQADLAAGLDQFFEPVRQDCPWCGSAALKHRLTGRDTGGRKPGVFTVDECRSCGHLFQNPMLNSAGLEFYYRDAYDGLGEDFTQGIFSRRSGYFRNQAETMVPFAKPEHWLDVGTGHAHFCNTARETWPQTRFDGVDFSSGIETAQRRGWIDNGYRGLFPVLAPTLEGRYDVVSMFHYLEHSTDPRTELAAAWRALRPGGHLMIEVPDPECRMSRLLGQWWGPWVQPQHLHFVPVGNLRTALAEQGFTVVAELHAEPHAPLDLALAALNLVNAVAPPRDAPWLAKAPTLAQRAARVAVFTAATPAMVAALAIDQAVKPLAERLRITNTYRVVAQKP